MNTKKIALLLITGITLTAVVFSCKKKDDDNDAIPPPIYQPVGDTIKPEITLTGGDQTILFSFNSIFTDPGYSATDNKDGNITAKVVVTGSVNRKSAGEYVLKYNVKDSSGNAALEKTRKVTVDAGLYIANAAGVSYRATGWYYNNTTPDTYIDTLFVIGINKFRFARLANWRNARMEVNISGINITANDTTLTTGTTNIAKTYKIISAKIISSGSSNLFEFKGSVTYLPPYSGTDEFYYTFSKL